MLTEMGVRSVRPRSRRDPGASRTARWTASAAALLAFAAWEGTLSRRAPGAHWSVLGAIGCALVVAAVTGRHLQRKPSTRWVRDGLGVISDDLRRRGTRGVPMFAGVAVWTALIAATIGWDLYSFSREARTLPTLSRLFGDVTGHDWGRALVFAGWLALGACLALGWRRHRSGERAP